MLAGSNNTKVVTPLRVAQYVATPVANLQANINLEATARSASDTALQTNINAEANARIALTDDLASSAGGEMVGAEAPNGEGTILQRHIVRNYLEDISGFVEGSGGNPTTNATVFNAAVASGVRYNMRPGALYKIGSSLVLPSNSALVFEGSNRPTIYMPAANFNNTNQAADHRYDPNAVGINCSGMDSGPYTPKSDVVLGGFVLQSEVLQGRCLRGIVGRNVSDITIDDIEMFGFPHAVGVCLASVLGNSWVRNCNIHDFTDNTVWGVLPQITAIELDNDRPNGIGSEHVRIINNRIKDITCGATFIAAHGYQTDGINVVHKSNLYTTIEGNHIENAGEGIDHFGCYASIKGNVAVNLYMHGLKMPHGASFNSANGNVIRKAGLAGIKFEGSSGDGPTQGNTLSGNEVSEIDHNGVWAANSTACVSFADAGGADVAKNNLLTGNVLNEGANGKYCWLDASAGPGNIGEGNHHIAGASNAARVAVTAGGGSARLAGSGTYSTSLV